MKTARVLQVDSAHQIYAFTLHAMLPTRQALSTHHAHLTCAAGDAFELQFRPLVAAGHTYAFPCDDAGHVDLDALGERGRLDYFYARSLVGRDFSMPAVQPSALH